MLAYLLWFDLAAAAETPTATSVCEILEHPERYKDKLVSVRAEVELWFETQALHDGHCEKGIWFEADASGAPGLRRVEQQTKLGIRWNTTVTAEAVRQFHSLRTVRCARLFTVRLPSPLARKAGAF